MNFKNTSGSASVPVKMLNSKNQSFTLWFKPVSGPEQIFDFVSPKQGLLTNIIITPFGREPFRLRLPLPFDACLLKVSSTGQLSILTDLSADKPVSETLLDLTHDSGTFYLLVTPLFMKEFAIRNITFFFHQLNPALPFLPPAESLTTERKPNDAYEIFDAVIRQQNGDGLHSQFPAVYLWYNDLLYFIVKTSFPGYAASTGPDAIVTSAMLMLTQKGFDILPREAVYQRAFFSNRYKVSVEHTWYGMQNKANIIPFSTTLAAKLELQQQKE